MSASNQLLKRKNLDSMNKENTKRAHTIDLPNTEDHSMEEVIAPPAIPRPTTPPLGMTLCHYNPNTGSYTSSQINSNHEVKSQICTGMTPVYRPPFERWGSCLI
ncbi:hypothetical protein A0J61_03913 [Choanephora cucurbitarum]|uniref:Uncharacterized protein n=1 Tax=Choanephora cucurbitarum TaxID=101091 RepID=A0A1C7NFU2_9FUNG|nr:hypothetical protein A0J61_03913 [Choanephora cucurbitarum]